MCRSKWKWPVTFPVVLAGFQTARQWTALTMSRGSLSLISSYVMLFPKCGHLLTERPGAFVSAHVFFSFFKTFFFSLSQLKMSTVSCTKQPSKVFWIAPGTTEVICQPVTQSVGNVCFMLLAECRELFALAAEQHGAWEAGCRWRGSQHKATAPFQPFCYGVLIVVFFVHKEVFTSNSIHISKELLFPPAISCWQQP